MQWITCKPASALGKAIPIGTKGEGEIPSNLVGKVQILIVATPQAEPEGSEVIEAELTEQVETAEVAEAEPEQAEPEAEKPTKGGKR